VARGFLVPTVVGDTSALAEMLDQSVDHLLSVAFQYVLLPRHVEVELRRRGPERRARLRRLIEDGTLRRCHDYPESVIEVWLGVLKSGPRSRNLGEAEALAQCQSRGVFALFSKDRKATRLAAGQDWEVFTPIDVVARVGEE
jgi:predicted nucleic acid-binding protein